MRDEDLDKNVLAGDEVIVPVFREQLPPHLSDKIVDILRIDLETPETDVFRATLEAMRQNNAKNHVEKVEQLFNKFRSSGLGVVGAPDTLSALNNGQVDELILRVERQEIRSDGQDGEDLPTGERELADILVSAAHQTAAKVTFIEVPNQLKEVGGVGALRAIVSEQSRFRIAGVTPQQIKTAQTRALKPNSTWRH